MKKILILIMTALLCVSLVACSPAFNTTVTDYSEGEVSSNGGFVVEKGEYVYFINGVEQKTAANKFGSVTKGALCRIKKSEIGTGEKAEMVIPKLMIANKNGANNGVFIFGDYVYYATASDRKDANGNVMNTTTEFTKTKLDGTDTKIIASIKDSDDFRYVKIDDSVYLALNTKNDDDKSVLRVYNADTQSLVKETEEIAAFMFSDDVEAQAVYYTQKVHNEQTDSDESFNALRMLKLDGTVDVEILSGAGTYTDAEDGIGIAGVTFGIVAVNKDVLILTETTVATSSVKMYYGMKISQIKTESVDGKAATVANKENLVLLDKGTSLANSIFSSTSIYVDLDCILYFDSLFGLVKYDYTKADVDFGRERVFYNPKMINSNMRFVKDGYVYMVDESVVFSRFLLSDVIDLETKKVKNAETKYEQVTFITLTESWYLPEIVGDYMFVNVSESPYENYVYAIDMTATKDMTDDQIKDYAEKMQTEDRDMLLEREKMLIGLKTDADSETFNKYLDEHYPQEEEASSQE